MKKTFCYAVALVFMVCAGAFAFDFMNAVNAVKGAAAVGEKIQSTPTPNPQDTPVTTSGKEKLGTQNIANNDFIVFLDAYQHVNKDHSYGDQARILAVSRAYTGSLIFKGQKYNVEPGSYDEWPDCSVDLKPGEAKYMSQTPPLGAVQEAVIEGGEKIITLYNTNIKRGVPAYSFDNANISMKEFNKDTEFYIGDTGKYKMYTIFHFSTTQDEDMETDKNTALYVIGMKGKFTLNDKEGIITIKDSGLKKGTAYYLTVCYYNSKFCYEGVVEARKMVYTGE